MVASLRIAVGRDGIAEVGKGAEGFIAAHGGRDGGISCAVKSGLAAFPQPALYLILDLALALFVLDALDICLSEFN